MDVMKCLNCGSSPATITYPVMIGAAARCECSNPSCRLYSHDRYGQAEEVPDAGAIEAPKGYTVNVDEEVDTAPRPVFLWCTHHHDFGD